MSSLEALCTSFFLFFLSVSYALSPAPLAPPSSSRYQAQHVISFSLSTCLSVFQEIGAPTTKAKHEKHAHTHTTTRTKKRTSPIDL